MSTSGNRPETRAVDVSFTGSSMRVALCDAREISVPLEWFPRLRDATPKQRSRWRLIGHGLGIHWEELDEDISVESLLDPGQTILFRQRPRRRARIVRTKVRQA